MAAIDTTRSGEPEFTVMGDMQPVTPLALRFTGSGSEYFRIWIVNLLLTIVTLSLYYPYARARRLRYFHANTLVDGQPLGFHGDPARMLRGYLLVLGLVAALQLAQVLSPLSGALGALAFGAAWPALWWSSLRFRLANTSWRGLRLRFSGSLGGAYAALLAGPGALLALGVALLVLGSALGDGAAARGAGAGSVLLPGLLAALVPLLMLALVPYLTARVRRYQHAHLHYAAEDAQFDAPVRAFYGLWARAGLLSLGLLLAVLVLVGVAAGLFTGGLRSLPGLGGQTVGPWAALVPLLLFGLVWLGIGPLMQGFIAARLQNLCWNHTRSQRVRFDSRLGVAPLAWLTLKNGLLTLLTLGLYRPFAAVATARLRLEAVTLQVTGDPAQWASPQPGADGGAVGDVAGDLLGVDLGL